MKITENGQAQTIATQTAKVVADATGTGTWSLNFGTLALEPGTKYVIFETATSEKPLVDTNKDNQPDAPHVVEHKNPNDLAQRLHRHQLKKATYVPPFQLLIKTVQQPNQPLSPPNKRRK